MSISDLPAVQRVQPHKAPLSRGQLIEDVDTVAQVFRALITEQGFAKAGRRMGIRINVDRVPTQQELVDAARHDGLSLTYLKVNETAR